MSIHRPRKGIYRGRKNNISCPIWISLGPLRSSRPGLVDFPPARPFLTPPSAAVAVVAVLPPSSPTPLLARIAYSNWPQLQPLSPCVRACVCVCPHSLHARASIKSVCLSGRRRRLDLAGWPLAKLSFCSEEIRGGRRPPNISSNDDRMRESESFGGEEEGEKNNNFQVRSQQPCQKLGKCGKCTYVEGFLQALQVSLCVWSKFTSQLTSPHRVRTLSTHMEGCNREPSSSLFFLPF